MRPATNLLPSHVALWKCTFVLACQASFALGSSCADQPCEDTDRSTFLQTGAHVGTGGGHIGWAGFNGNGNGNSSPAASLLLHPFDFSEVNVHLPENYTGQVPLPLVVMLHGYSSYPDLYMNLYGLQDRINTDKFIQIIPPGRKDSGGLRSWQAWGSRCGNCAVSSAGPCCGDGDVEYLRTMIYAATRNFNVDKQRIYVNGHSDGAAMAYRMACDASDLLAGVMIMAGSPPEDNWKPSYVCKPSHPISVLHIHGTADADVAYDGSIDPRYKGAVRSTELFAGFNACPKLNGRWFPAGAATKGKTEGVPQPEMMRLFTPGSGNDTELFRASGCNGGTEVELWKILGCGHSLCAPFAKDSYQKHSVAWLLRQRKSVAPSIKAPQCVDRPLSWEDSHGNVCQEYGQHKWCNTTGGYGAGWKDYRGWFKDYAVKNITATTACCACGGGANTLNLR